MLDTIALQNLTATKLGEVPDLQVGDRVNFHSSCKLLEERVIGIFEGKLYAFSGDCPTQDVEGSFGDYWTILERADGWYFPHELNLREGDIVRSSGNSKFDYEVVKINNELRIKVYNEIPLTHFKIEGKRWWKVLKRVEDREDLKPIDNGDTVMVELITNVYIKDEDYDQLSDENDDLKDEVHQLRLVVEDRDKDIKKLNDAIDDRDETIRSLFEEIEGLKASNKAYHTCNVDLAAQLNKSEEERKSLNDTNNKLCLERSQMLTSFNQIRDLATRSSIGRR